LTTSNKAIAKSHFLLKNMLFNHFFHFAARNEQNPHSLLGLHILDDGRKVVRLYRPHANDVYIEIFGNIVKLEKISDSDLFELTVPETTTFKDYRIYHQNGSLSHDPYAFGSSVSHYDEYLFSKGVHYELYKVLGAHLCEIEGVSGTRFAVWAPSAVSVSLVADFNFWDGRVNPMRLCGSSGIFELFVPGVEAGEKYKFEIKTKGGEILLKVDPYAFACEVRPATASVVAKFNGFKWKDANWMLQRKEVIKKPYPLNIYEVHLGSWKKNNGEFLNYRQAAVELAKYCSEMGFTHVELMPIQEHPLDESWGYQVSCFFAPTSRFGSPEDFQWFVNHLHENGVGVILDWVPGHFPTDNFALGRFDGTALYEHEDLRQGLHPHWNTYIFNFGRHEVSNFLIANAIYWFEEMHVDGLRVDAVASMLYLDYGRNEGEWIPNKHGGRDNLEAIEFFKHLNSIVHKRCPDALMFAEESTSFPGVTHPVAQGGLGFDLKWNMGWMNDTLRYFSTDPLYRCYHHNDLTFGLLYAFSEHFALPLSHDEVVHGKGSLLGKMPGDVWQQFANMRLLYSYMICQPGKKLFFMGGEIGQWNEWNCKGEIEWFLLNFPVHHSLQTMVKDINHFYLSNKALWQRDFDFSGFEWVDFNDSKNSVISYLRKSADSKLLCVHNLTPAYHHEYVIYFSNFTEIAEVFNSDCEKYGGSGKYNKQVKILRDERFSPYAIQIHIAPLATMIFKIE